jgi:hypothetical protein
MASHLVNVSRRTDQLTLGAFAYLLDYEPQARLPFSTATYGVRALGKQELGATDLVYEAEIAQQGDYAENPGAIDVDYVRLELGAGRSGWSGKLGYERLGSDGASAFQTPLGTNHKFNGFADLFLVTPSTGLEDLYARLAYKRGPWSSLLDYHRFAADRGSLDYGDEIDAELIFTSSWKQLFALKIALYDADQFSTDTDKIMAWTSWGF